MYDVREEKVTASMLGRIENYVLEKEGVAISGRVCEEHFEVLQSHTPSSLNQGCW
jgi:hypothetical protein